MGFFQLYVTTSAIVILVSIFVLVASTHPIFQRELDKDELKEFLEDNQEEMKKYEVNMIKAEIKDMRNNMKETGDKSSNKKLRGLKKQLKTLRSELRVLRNLNRTHYTTDPTINAELEEAHYENDTLFDIMNTHTRFRFLTIMDYFTVAFFLLELAVRIVFCPDKKKFFRSFLNIVDIIALSSESIIMFFEYLFPKEKYTDYSPLDFIECIQIARVFRLFRLVKNFIGFRVFIYSVRASFKNMALMVFLMLVAALIFSAVIFYCDRSQFTSIPDAIWWAIVTMTTVGYGDLVPKSLLGKMIGCLCAVTGVFVLAVLIPVLVSNFILFIGFARIPIRNGKNDLANMMKQEFIFRKDNNEFQLLTKKNKLKVYNASGSP